MEMGNCPRCFRLSENLFVGKFSYRNTIFGGGRVGGSPPFCANLGAKLKF